MKHFALKFLALVMVIALQGTAADLYVSSKGGKNKNPGTTPSAPLKSIYKAIEMAKNGDVIHVAAGKYRGKMSCGWINLNKPVSLIGGYSKDFKERNPLVHQTMLRPTNDQNKTKPTFGTLTIQTQKFGPSSKIVIDGFIFDHTDANSYHPVKGKPEGFKHGQLTIPPAKGATKNPSIDKDLLNAKTDGDLTIQNCLFLNGSRGGIIAGHYSGNVKILNNVFIGNRNVACDIRTTNGQPFKVNYEFAYNTVLLSWPQKVPFETMGYGIRSNDRMVTNVHHNIFGLNVNSGFDNTKGRDKEKKVTLENNVFFLNRLGDVTLTMSPSIKYAKVEDDDFEDISDMDGFESVADNASLSDPKLFKGILDETYLKAFLSMTYSENTEYDENSPANVFRQAMGLNKQGKITTKVSMFANPYPFDSAIKFFGVVPEVGAQKIK